MINIHPAQQTEPRPNYTDEILHRNVKMISAAKAIREDQGIQKMFTFKFSVYIAIGTLYTFFTIVLPISLVIYGITGHGVSATLSVAASPLISSVMVMLLFAEVDYPEIKRKTKFYYYTCLLEMYDK